MERITKWKKIRDFDHSIGFGLGHPEFDAGIFPKGFFDKEFDKAISITADENMKSWIHGFRKRVDATPYSYGKIKKLKNRLDHLDKRRQTNWRELWPWLDKYEDDS